MSDVSDTKESDNNAVISISDLKQNKTHHFTLRWQDSEMIPHSDQLGLKSVKKVSVEGEISAQGRKDWILKAKVGASVVQSCVVSMEDVKTRLDVEFTRRYLHDFEDYEAENTTEEELDAEIEPIPSEIDLLAMTLECIMLNLDEYPRLEGIALETTLAAPKGVEPLTDEAVKPFASLASLKDKLERSK